jgi:hypothetical protein
LRNDWSLLLNIQDSFWKIPPKFEIQKPRTAVYSEMAKVGISAHKVSDYAFFLEIFW